MRNELLRRALLANAAFSAVTAILALVLGGRLEESLGPPAWSIRALGAGLLAFAALVAHEAREPSRRGARPIIAADLAWVVGAIAIIAVTPDWLTDTGSLVLASVTAVVATLAAAPWRGLRRAAAGRAQSATVA